MYVVFVNTIIVFVDIIEMYVSVCVSMCCCSIHYKVADNCAYFEI